MTKYFIFYVTNTISKLKYLFFFNIIKLSFELLQVHTRIQYLRETIYSLSKARGIEDAILIFSHDYYDTEINSFIRGIDFCKTIQIFFPYSSQIYTKIFPGQSPYDCPDITRDE